MTARHRHTRRRVKWPMTGFPYTTLSYVTAYGGDKWGTVYLCSGCGRLGNANAASCIKPLRSKRAREADHALAAFVASACRDISL